MSGYIAAGSLAMAVIGTGMSVAGQAQQAQATSAAAGYQSQVARNNQMIMEKNAEYDQQRGDIAVENSQLKTAQTIGSQRAALATQGGDVDSGSDLDIQGDTARAGETDALTIRSNTARQVWNDQVQGEGYGAQAGLLSMTGANALSSLPYGMGSTLLGGASSVGMKWVQYQQAAGKTPVTPTAGDTMPFTTDI